MGFYTNAVVRSSQTVELIMNINCVHAQITKHDLNTLAALNFSEFPIRCSISLNNLNKRPMAMGTWDVLFFSFTFLCC